MTARDEYKDMIGSYWIGAEGRAKLCFCRILRSRTVMVRVGGGWVELSKYVCFDHYPSCRLTCSGSYLTILEHQRLNKACLACRSTSRWKKRLLISQPQSDLESLAHPVSPKRQTTPAVPLKRAERLAVVRLPHSVSSKEHPIPRMCDRRKRQVYASGDGASWVKNR